MPFIGPKPADTVLDSTLIADGTITSAKIADGAIVNADLNSSAAIATSKISGLAASATTDTTNAANISSGTIADARISSSSVTQHVTSFDDNKLVNDLSTLALRQSSNENKAAYNTNSMYVDVFQDSSGVTNLTNTVRNANEYVDTNLVSQHTLFSYTMEHSSGTGNNTGSQTPTSDINGSYTSTTRRKFGSRGLYGMDSVNPMFRHYDASGIATDFHMNIFLHTNGLSSNSYFKGFQLNFGSGNKIEVWKFRSGYSHGGWVTEYGGGTTNNWANNGDSNW